MKFDFSQINVRLLLLGFVVGAIVGTTGDFVHVITRTDGYPPNGPFPFLPFLPVLMPVWVPFLFGGALMLMAASYKVVEHWYTPRMAGNRALALATPFLFTGVYALTGFIQAGTGTWQDVWLAAVAISFWWLADGTRTGALLALLNAVCGTLFEIMLVNAGGFFYYPEHANLLGVPSWLPWLYVCAGLCISLFTRVLK